MHVKTFTSVPLILMAMFCLSCSNMNRTATGAATGTAIGSGLGAIIGHQSGRAGEGTAIGGAFGLLAGALLGNQADKQERRAQDNEAALDRQQREIEQGRQELAELKQRIADNESRERRAREKLEKEERSRARSKQAQPSTQTTIKAQTEEVDAREEEKAVEARSEETPESTASGSVWKVKAINGSNVTVGRKSGDSPRVSEDVEIYFMIDDIDVKARKATGKIEQVSASQFTVAVDPDSITGDIEVGNLVGPVQ